MAKNYIPYKGFFPYSEIETMSHVPSFISALANFDGVHYIKIAMHGYEQYDQAYFPLYPLFMRLVSIFFGSNYLLIGVIIANAFFFIGVIYLYKLCQKIANEKIFWWLFAFILLFPTSFFFSAVYTEGIFFMLFMGALYHLRSERFLFAAMFAILAALTKFIGVFLIVPFFFYFWFEKKQLSLKNILILISPLIGLALYVLYLFKTTGDPFFFFTSQKVFANRSTHIILLPQVYYRYLKIFISNQFSVAYFIALIEVVLFSIGILASAYELLRSYKKKDYFFFALSIFSLLCLILPTLTGTFSSIPRYMLFAPSFFFFVANIASNKIKVTLLCMSSIVQLVLFMLFIQGYFVS